MASRTEDGQLHLATLEERHLDRAVGRKKEPGGDGFTTRAAEGRRQVGKIKKQRLVTMWFFG